MPPRKSNQSANGGAEDGGSGGGRDTFGVEDLSLPKTMIQRLAKGVLPANTQIQKDALLALSKSATVFVSYLSAHAGENATRANKKTIQPKDVFDAMHDLEFDGFLPRLEAELAKYNTVQSDKRNTYRRKVREEQLAAKSTTAKELLAGEAGDAGSQSLEGDPSGPQHDGDEAAPPAAKKMRRSDADGGDAMAVDPDEDEEGDGADEDEDQDDDEVEHDEVEDEAEDEDDEARFDDPNSQLVHADDPVGERENDGIGDEALDGDESD